MKHGRMKKMGIFARVRHSLKPIKEWASSTANVAPWAFILLLSAALYLDLSLRDKKPLARNNASLAGMGFVQTPPTCEPKAAPVHRKAHKKFTK